MAPKPTVGFDAAIRREIVRRLVEKNSRPEQAPEFSQEHPDLDFMLGGKGNPYAPLLMRIFDVVSSIIEEERGHLRRASQRLDEREADFEEETRRKSSDDGLPEDVCGTLESAIQKYGSRGHKEARLAIGQKLYDAIKAIGPQACWSWLCRQHISDLPRFAKKIEQSVGRSGAFSASYKSKTGNGTHFKNNAKVSRRAVHPDDLPHLLAPLIKGQRYYFPLDMLREYRLTASDWNSLVGRTLKKAEMGFISRSGFGAYLLKSVQSWEQSHPIPTTKGEVNE